MKLFIVNSIYEFYKFKKNIFYIIFSNNLFINLVFQSQVLFCIYFGLLTIKFFVSITHYIIKENFYFAILRGVLNLSLTS